MQKSAFIFIYLFIIAGVVSSIEIENLAGIPSDVVCAMSVCPSQTASLSKRAPPCPSVCKDDCVIVDDVCCPGNQKAVCNTTAISQSGSSATPTPSKSAISSTLSPSSSVSITSSVASSSSVATSSPVSSAPSAIPASAGSFIQPSIMFSIIAIALCLLKLN